MIQKNKCRFIFFQLEFNFHHFLFSYALFGIKMSILFINLQEIIEINILR